MQVHRMTSQWPWIFNRQKYLSYTKYIPLSTLHTLRPPNTKSLVFLLYDKLFSRYKVVENRKILNALNDLRLTVNTNGEKYPHKYLVPPEAQIVATVALRLSIFKILQIA